MSHCLFHDDMHDNADISCNSQKFYLQLSNLTMNFLENEIPVDNLEHLAKLQRLELKTINPQMKPNAKEDLEIKPVEDSTDNS